MSLPFFLLIFVLSPTSIPDIPHAGKIPDQNGPDVRVAGVVIRVLDLHASRTFYRDVLGLPLPRDGDGRITLDGGGMPIYLEQAEGRAAMTYPEGSQTVVVFQTGDIRATMERLRDAGIEFLGGDEPQPYGFNRETRKPLGLSARFRDPSGIVHSLVEEQAGEAPPTGIRVYNVGFYLPDLAGSRTLFCDVLGFQPLTDAYLPAALPLTHPDGTLAFVLHARPGLKPRSGGFPDETGAQIVFESGDLDATKRLLRSWGIDVRAVDPAAVLFRDTFGNLSRIVQRG